MTEAEEALDVGPNSIERMHMIGETVFGAVAKNLHKQGWMAFPQNRSGPRMPAKVDGRPIKISRFHMTGPSAKELHRWSLAASSANAALLMGPCSGNTWTLDLDIDDVARAVAVKALADEHLGVTPFERYSTSPRFARIYRSSSADDLPRGRKVYLYDGDGLPSGDMIEILSKGRAITAFGPHHSTGENFSWNKTPAYYGPEIAPVISQRQIDAFLGAVAAAFPAAKTSRQPRIEYGSVDVDGIQIPRPHAEGRWVEENGVVVDGREALLWQLSRETVRRNPALVRSDNGLGAIVAALTNEFRARAPDDVRWPDAKLEAHLLEKVARAARMLDDGAMTPWTSGRVMRAVVPTVVDARADVFSFLRTRRADLDVTIYDAEPGAAEARRLRTDRTDATVKVSAGIAAAQQAFFDDVYNDEARIHVLRAPTGSGKTTNTMRAIAADPRTFAFDGKPADQNPGPYLFMLPTYLNISEVRLKADILNLDPMMFDDELADAAAALGLVQEGSLEDHLKTLRRDAMNAGLETEVYRGKIAAGCLKPEAVELLMAAGRGTSGLCHTTIVNSHSANEQRFCQHYDNCPAITQRRRAAQAHVVFLPRNFLDLTIPDELDRVRGVIADETIFNLLVHTDSFPLAILDLERDAPEIMGDEDDGDSPAEMLMHRKQAVALVKRAFDEGRCPADALAEFTMETPEGKVTGADLARQARRVCGQSMTRGRRIHPHLGLEQIERICRSQTGADIKQEHRMWQLLCERLTALEDGTAKGASEGRVRLLASDTTDPTIQLSWLTQANWETVPMLLLDASGDPEIIRRVFTGREVVEHRVEVDLNLQTLAVIDRRFAMRNLLPPLDAGPEAHLQAAKLLHEVRCVISEICGVHAHGFVAFGMPKALRKLVCSDWLPPLNSDFVHAGAESGLDFARRHVAVASIGRLELPLSEIDAQVAALTANDDMPEAPIDPTGNGVDLDGKTVYPNATTRCLKLRDGRDFSYETHEHAGPIARAVQAQYREEKVRQIIGRSRPVFRNDTPIAIVIGQAIPDDLIIDEVAAWEDLVKSGANYWDVVRKAGGILSARMMLSADADTATEAEYQAWIDTLPAMVLDRYSSVPIAFAGRDTVTIYVPGWIESIGQHVVDWCRMLRLRGTYLGQQLARTGHRVDPAPEGRPIDEIETRLGDHRRRRVAEMVALHRVRQVVQRRSTWLPGKGSFRAGDGEIALMAAPLGAWAAMPLLRDSWIRGDDSAEAPAERDIRVRSKAAG
jgi:hypothetical protein